MKQHALRTAMTLYEGDTLDLRTAANQAGVSPDRLRRAVRRSGGSIPSPGADAGPVTVGAD
ncbi:hypothetical protein [Natronomonas sp. LN261]|uniref:hypothetical protein n=1 Tax=Natronomonas sp. LN261 TaxID=2750669 RepID=UPI0015EEF7A9|nr:hypothetical protein [Natronomonas sp. LN261]